MKEPVKARVSLSEDATIRAMLFYSGSKPCEAYHSGFRTYMRCKTPEMQAKWRNILARLKERFPEGGCEHVVS